MEDLERYLDEVVDPTIEDYAKDPTSRRKAFLACVAAFHSIDYLAYDAKRRKTNKATAGNLRKEFRKSSGAFAQIDDIAHAFKHVVSGGREKLHAQQVITRPPGRLGEMRLGLSRLGDPFGGVTISSNISVDLLDNLREVLRFLRGKTGTSKRAKAHTDTDFGR